MNMQIKQGHLSSAKKTCHEAVSPNLVTFDPCHMTPSDLTATHEALRMAHVVWRGR